MYTYIGPHQEHAIVRCAPQQPLSTKQPGAKLQSAKSTEDENSEGPTLEPSLQTRKKCPELAYKTYEFITTADDGGIDAIDSNVVADKEVTSALPPSQLNKAISGINTEYQLQFAWPEKPQLINGETQAPVLAAGFSAASTGHYPAMNPLSMGALKQGIMSTRSALVYKKQPGDFGYKHDGIQMSEVEPLGSGTDAINGMVSEGVEREEDMTDLKITFRSVKEEEGKKNKKVAPIASMIAIRPPAGQPTSEHDKPIHGFL